MSIEEVGIKYKKINVDKYKYVLIPLDYIEGYSVGNIYYSDKEYKIPTDIKTLKNEKILVDNIIALEDLKYTYDYDEDIEFLKNYYYEDEKDYLIIIDTSNNIIDKKKIKLNRLMDEKRKELYNEDKTVTLNEDSLERLLSLEDIQILKKELLRIRKSVSEFNGKEKLAKQVLIENDLIKGIVVNAKIKEEIKSDNEEKRPIREDISLRGLEKYVKERVFGHDEEIRYICKTLMMNYTAKEDEEREPLLLVGMTGTGKTETIKAASRYLDSPFVEVNTINLVPQGIKGISLEDCLYSLIVQAEDDIKKAERGLIFFDEFDKLGGENVDYKEPIKSILLKFIEGSKFIIGKEKRDYIFDTSKLNMVFSGVFEEIHKREKHLGFNQNIEEKEVDLMSNIVNKNYYGKELLTRIKHFYLFDELSIDTKKRILLESKLSEYKKKKERYKRQFNVELIADDSYIDRILEKLHEENKSIRELNSLVSNSLEEIEYELLDNNHSNQKLNLTKDIVDNKYNFDFKMR